MKKVQKPYKFGQMRSVTDFTRMMSEDGLDFPISEDMSVLGEPIELDGRIIPNRLAIQPLEGFDGKKDGNPSDLIFRRYRRYAAGGAGLIWYESISISDDGRCNPLQMIIKESTLSEIARLVRESNEAAITKFGRRPYNVLQLTHSGRRSADENWVSTPLVAVRNPYADSHCSIDGQSGEITIVTDEKIEEIVQQFIEGANLAMRAGFDSVDVKVCHEYILRELLSAFTREGKYGGSFENRTRALFEIIDGIRETCGDGIDICVRLNAYDCIPYPYGWGMVKEDGVMKPDLSEPIKLCRMLVEKGVKLINLSTMMPRYQPYGSGCLAEHDQESIIEPYKGVYELLKATKEIKDAVPGAIFVSTGMTWLEQFGGNVSAGSIEKGWFDIGGFGRQAFAYPDFAEDILKENTMYRKKCCVLCDKCYELIQDAHTVTGCVMRDQEVYMPIYRQQVLHQDLNK